MEDNNIQKIEQENGKLPFFKRDEVVVGLVAGLGSEVGYIVALTIGLLVAGEAPLAHARWYGGMFIALILVLRHYAKRGENLKVTKTLIVVLFATFIAFMFYLFASRTMVLE